MVTRKRLREMGVPEDMSADDVKALFGLPDDHDRMHMQTFPEYATKIDPKTETCICGVPGCHRYPPSRP